MTSEAQVEANIENSQKSTGPKTEEGKAVSRFNALKHGILSSTVLVNGEDENELLELGSHLRQGLKPASEIELILVDRIIANTWRLKRALRGEREMIEHDTKKDGVLGYSRSFGEVLSELSNYDSYGKFIRYETAVERGIFRALHELQRLQAARAGEKPPAPIAVDVDISTD